MADEELRDPVGHDRIRHKRGGVLSRVLEHAEAAAPAGLWTAGALAPWRHRVAAWPDALGQELILESALTGISSEGSGAVDLSVQIRPSASGRCPLPPALYDTPHGQRLAAFADRWVAAPDGHAFRSPALGLEFDADVAVEDAANVFFNLLPGGQVRDFDVAAPAFRRDFMQAWTDLAGTAPSPATARHVMHCLDVLPAEGRIFLCALMLARGRDGLRLCVTGLGLDALVDYAGACGWRGPAWQEALPKALSLDAVWTVLHLDVGAGLGPGIGLECYPRQADGDSDWASWLDTLAATDGVSAPAIRALRRWPGVDWLRDKDLLLPVMLERTLSHIKFTLNHRGHWAAKSYVTLFQRPLTALTEPSARLIERFWPLAGEQ